MTTTIPHPGMRIKAEVIPKGMSVTNAAALMGVGRPALSNLLNGNASLSPDMAARLESAFKKLTSKQLLDMQAAYDAAQAKKQTPADTKTYVPPFLGIKANQIEGWVEHNISARTRLSVLLRTLVHSTSRGLTKVDFPGNDDAERPGWDGFVDASEGTPWIPAGKSGWEFGTNDNIKKKATDDFSKSVKALDENERSTTTFVFVTPRQWPGKKVWADDARAKGQWKDVRAYDASDLEQWLEQSIPGQAWFANETAIPAQGVRSLDKCWSDWSEVASPPLIGTLFAPAIDTAKRVMAAQLSKPPERPIVVAADSTEEALAFLSQIFSAREGDDLGDYRDRVLVFDVPGALPRVTDGAQTFIPVATTREVERELALNAKAMHSVVVYPRNAANIEADIVLEPLNYEAFSKALTEMGYDRDDVNRLGDESGRSLTVLRRRLAHGALRTPEWAGDTKTAVSLVPFLLVGAWQSTNDADRLALSLLAGDRSYEELEKDLQALALLNDAPVWSVGSYRGVISKVDLLHAIANAVTAEDIRRYQQIAEMVLGEDDPSLDFDGDKHWAAAMYGKIREFSGAFRDGISETLVLLSIYGGRLFRQRLGIDTASEASRLVRALLKTPLSVRVLEANGRDLPTYAEAAPDEFLTIIERDLQSNDPAVLGLLRPADNSIFGRGPSRTGLLWALEGLSWNPETLPRAARILARLAQVEINDNWVNKPTNSLEAIFRAWMPQTAASPQARIDLMKDLARRYPEVAWKLCVAQFGDRRGFGSYSHKPRWRSDGFGFGEPYKEWPPILDFIREMIEMALQWQKHSLVTLSDLVERVRDLPPEAQPRVWKLIELWAQTATDAEKAAMREKIRRSTLSRRAALRAKRDPQPEALIVAAKAAFEALSPIDPLNKHAWLFREQWVDEFADEIEDIENMDFAARDVRIQRQRADAMREIVDQRGVSGLLDLAKRGNTAWAIGWIAVAEGVLNYKQLVSLLKAAFQPIVGGKDDLHSVKNVIGGALRATPDDQARSQLISAVGAGLSESDIVKLLVLAPYSAATWKLVDALGDAARARYWAEVGPEWLRTSDAENNESVERLLKAGRPRAAFSCIRFAPEKLDAQVLFRLMSDMAVGGNDKPGEYQLEQYWVDRAFQYLNASPTLTLDQKAGLEYAYLDVLSRPWDRQAYGVPNLSRYIEKHPQLFIQAIAWVYRRKDDGKDPEELGAPADRAQEYADRGYKLLEAIHQVPGRGDFGEIQAEDLGKWIATVRQTASEIGRADVADIKIGELLSRAPAGKNGIWPCEPVCQVLEDLQSEMIMRGMHTGVYNSRGAHFRGEGGDQERELAERYRKWAHALQPSFPYVSSVLLMGMVRTYEAEASREDTDAGIRRRMR